MRAHYITDNWEEFKPREYLKGYYSDMTSENFSLLKFFAESAYEIPEVFSREAKLLDFGCGPTVYSVASVAHRVKEIHLCDYSDANLNEVRQWLHNVPDAFDWHDFIKKALEFEHQICNRKTEVSEMEIEQRENLIRHRVSQIFSCDANCSPPIDYPYSYDVLISTCCADSATTDKVTWSKYLKNICSLVKPGGTIVLSALEEASHYLVGDKAFPAVFLSEKDIEQCLLEEGFTTKNKNFIPASESSSGYKGIRTILAHKKQVE
ncbi:MAG: guanitoxin biosynthesis pre-guanitoxin forming N-methyltransferase GntF [Candidatus Electrothrix aestuarii]|uniref:Guanitoxin biosynthesis pre-guanitoxin forming N-methyltransferase GntF n=1 Tax=Candidatus Electrothrix aestuarii TaxID=3062594 RepID=A0AAU8LVF7_9BACT|nr:guanitoxin biosynthesis pre-guanitoxin forming N-methyltransferase GntF [Candidatus Electrothrix aestuarii]WPD21963.1 MAG: guanitoxin biosynthesis pre-guanitoxin forming N-methyltransferase GntF [Candidatus Electrothrix sp. GW3-3]